MSEGAVAPEHHGNSPDDSSRFFCLRFIVFLTPHLLNYQNDYQRMTKVSINTNGQVSPNELVSH